MNNKADIEEDIKILEVLRRNLGLSTNGNKIKEGFAIENILADREKYKQLYEKALSDLVSVEKEKEIHIKLEHQYKKEYLDIKDKYDGLIKEIEDKIKTLNKQEKEELKGAKGQDRYYIKQKYMYQRNVLQELLDKEKN